MPPSEIPAPATSHRFLTDSFEWAVPDADPSALLLVSMILIHHLGGPILLSSFFFAHFFFLFFFSPFLFPFCFLPFHLMINPLPHTKPTSNRTGLRK
ncbi:hypothetical protein BO78DRAFT_78256 [Aspergillus sclerotiicarbonarius CBS 121057]|uniref:Uncharacterized protein n=1 Tax=Aspergillus sclerotiicarbonarius (strain CBS 121057 / IBT 28362) TaxID=1448318 RepID=A0A319EV90_ASPSB|nr:hypothetical protein BO78DRAFT_78256 [Aspergillus sclerotiicarbonarius CBS 121057]